MTDWRSAHPALAAPRGRPRHPGDGCCLRHGRGELPAGAAGRRLRRGRATWRSAPKRCQPKQSLVAFWQHGNPSRRPVSKLTLMTCCSQDRQSSVRTVQERPESGHRSRRQWETVQWKGTPATAKRKQTTPAARGGGSTGRGRGKKEPVPTLPEIAAGFRLLQPAGGKHLRKSSVIQVSKRQRSF